MSGSTGPASMPPCLAPCQLFPEKQNTKRKENYYSNIYDLHSLLPAPFSLTKHVLVCQIISITYFVMKNKVPCCVINVMLSTTTKLMQQKLHMEIVIYLYTLQ